MSDPGPLRICIVTDAYLPSIGGVENHILHLSAELKRLGHDVSIVTHRLPAAAGRIPGQVESPVPVHRLDGGLVVFREHDIAFDPRMVAAFRRLLDRSRFDIVHGQSEGSYLVYEALAAARRRRVATVLTRHSLIQNKPAVARQILMFLTRLLARRADGLIAVSQSVTDESAGFPGRVRTIPNGVDLNEFKPMPEERRRVRAGLGLAEDDVVLGYIGRMHTTKGVPLLLAVFEEVRRRAKDEGQGANVKLLLAGPGPLRSAIAERVHDSSGAIRLLEPQPFDKVASLLNALDVFAFPSRGEAFGISVLEAMACGLPSVAFGRWGVKDLVTDEDTGLLAEGQGAFVEKLGRLCSDKKLRARVGRAARESVAVRFSWSHVAAETVAFYRELVRIGQPASAA